jgi:vacuolar-type H+-ATPase subunit E/Vma4
MVNQSLPALEGFAGLIADISDSTTFAGGTVKALTDTLGAFFGFITSNFGVLLAFTALIATVTTAIKLYTVAAAFAAANPIGAAIILLGGAFIIGANGAKTLTDDVNLAGASLKAFNGNLENAAESGVYAGGKFGLLKLDFAAASDEAIRLGREVANADSAKLTNLKDSIMSVRISAAEAANELRRMTIYAGVKPSTTTKTGPTSVSTAAADAAERALREQEKAAREQEKAARELQDAMDKAARELADAQEKAARELQDAMDKAAQEEADRIQRREDAYRSFADSVKSIFGGIKESIMSSFNLPDLGNSVNSITRNIQKLLSRTKDFARNIKSLSEQGLTNDLLQQVIAAGPMEGGRLAQALAGAGGSFIGQLNQAYGEFGGIASDIAGVGARSAFGNQEVINNYYQIEVSGGVGSGPTIGKAIVDAIKSYERTSGAVWQGA